MDRCDGGFYRSAMMAAWDLDGKPRNESNNTTVVDCGAPMQTEQPTSMTIGTARATKKARSTTPNLALSCIDFRPEEN
jgi:hypothetical protein